VSRKWRDAEVSALRDAVDEVLFYLWDPIGIGGEPKARDEYSGYVPQIVGLLRDERAASDIARRLSEITATQMGMSKDAKRDLAVAELLLDWKRLLREKYA
jgi:hypothetical protein